MTERGKLRVVCPSSGTCEPAKSNVDSDTEPGCASPECNWVSVVEYWLPSDEPVPYTSENDRGLEHRGLSSEAFSSGLGNGSTRAGEDGGRVVALLQLGFSECVVQLPATETQSGSRYENPDDRAIREWHELNM